MKATQPTEDQLNFRKRLLGAMCAIAMVATGLGVMQAQATAAPADKGVPASRVEGQSVKVPAMPSGNQLAKPMQPKGPSQQVMIDKAGKPIITKNWAGTHAGVNFASPINYCWRHRSYVPVTNSTATTQYYRMQVYTSSNGQYREMYSSIAANSTNYTFFDGVEGTYYGYLYVYVSGSGYVYDEFLSNANNCNVTVTLYKSASTGYVYLQIRNLGNAYATVVSRELAPYLYGPYYDSPATGGGTINRYYYVGTTYRYGIVADLNGAFRNSWNWTGYY